MIVCLGVLLKVYKHLKNKGTFYQELKHIMTGFVNKYEYSLQIIMEEDFNNYFDPNIDRNLGNYR